MQLVLIGPPGAGKGTLAKEILARRKDLPYISSGDIARELAKTDPLTRERLRAGLMAPEESMRERTLHAVEAALATTGEFVLDGYPRSIAQLHTVLALPAAPTFVEVECQTLTCMERLHRRNRAGEDGDAVSQRLADFERETRPMLEILEAGGRLNHINNEHKDVDSTVNYLLEFVIDER